MNAGREERIGAAAMVPEGEDEFWALVGPDRSPSPPYARSRAEFELKLAAAGVELTGKEVPPVDVGLPAGFYAINRVKAFEIKRISKKPAR